MEKCAKPTKQALHCRTCTTCKSTRRNVISVALIGIGALRTQDANADVLKDIAVQLVRPQDIDRVTAVVRLLDAKSVLKEMQVTHYSEPAIQELANTPMDSKERFKARVLLPAYAKRLREVGPAIGTLSMRESDEATERQFSERYGGEGTGTSPETAVYITVGRSITISGRTVQEAALEERSTRATDAIRAIDDYLATLSPSLIEEAQAVRVARAKQVSR